MHALPVVRFLFSLEYQSCLSSLWLCPIFSQGQSSPVFSHKQNLMVQMQSKDMAPRFGKKGKVNADEVRPIDWSPCKIPFCGVSLCCGVLIYQLLRLHPSDQPQAGAVLCLEQETSAEAAATDDHESCPGLRPGGVFIHYPVTNVPTLWVISRNKLTYFPLSSVSTAWPENEPSSNPGKTGKVH